MNTTTTNTDAARDAGQIPTTHDEAEADGWTFDESEYIGDGVTLEHYTAAADRARKMTMRLQHYCARCATKSGHWIRLCDPCLAATRAECAVNPTAAERAAALHW